MNKLIYAFILLSGLFNLVTALDNTIWSRTYGGSLSEGTRSICLTPDNGFLLAGYAYSQEDKKTDLSLVKTDSSGNLLWSKKYGINGWIYSASSCSMQNNTGYLITGRILNRIQTDNNFDLYIAGTDLDGNLMWSKTYGGTGNDYAETICPVSDGNYLICGATSSQGIGDDDVWLVKINAVGDTIWTKTYGSTKSDMGYCAIESSAGNYLITGSSSEFDTPGVSSGRNRDIYAIKTDTNGNLIKSATYWVIGGGQVDSDCGYSICELAGTNFCIAGSSSKSGAEPQDIVVLKIDNELNLIWKKNKEIDAFYDFGYLVCAAADDNSIMIAGSFSYPVTCTTDGFVLKYNQDGIEIYNRKIGGDRSDCFRAIKHVSEDNYVIAGYTDSFGSGAYDAWLIKYRDNQVMIEDNSKPDINYLKQNYPNPFNPETNIEFSLPQKGFVSLNIYNSSGETLCELINSELTAGVHQVKWQQTDSGTYFYTLKYNGISTTRKMIVLK